MPRAILVGLVAVSFARAAGAEPPSLVPPPPKPATRALTPEEYEEAWLSQAIATHGCRRDPRPEGKRITRIEVVTGEVFADLDRNQLRDIPIVGLWPSYANYLHATTRRHVVEREVLFSVGQPFRQALAAETERNLRAIVIFNIARVVPCRGAAPDEIEVLVVTKDLWSLRVETDFQVAAGQLDFLRVAVIERNLAGRYKQLSGVIGMTRDTLSLGQGFFEPRLAGTRIALEESAAIVFGRGGRGPEGASGRFVVGQPLYALDAKWGFEVGGEGSLGIARRFRGTDFFRCFAPRGATGLLCDSAPIVLRSALLQSADHMALVYESRQVDVGASVFRRFGTTVKHDLSWGYGLRHRDFALVGDAPNAAFRDAFAASFVPRSEDASFLFVGYRTFDPTFRTFNNINRFALTEDYQIGHDVRVIARWANKVFGVDYPFLELAGRVQYRWQIGPNNLLTVFGQAETRGEAAGSINAQMAGFVNNRFALGVSNISPVLGVGRLIFDAVAVFRFDDRDNLRTALGGNQGLRGYDNDQFRGRHALNLHLEYRSLPLDFKTVQLGFVAFYDGGHAADELGALRLRHSLGVGLRLFFPQINRMVLRADLGFPLNDGPGDFGRQLSISFDQAF